jgi:hypothetical protein
VINGIGPSPSIAGDLQAVARVILTASFSIIVANRPPGGVRATIGDASFE